MNMICETWSVLVACCDVCVGFSSMERCTLFGTVCVNIYYLHSFDLNKRNVHVCANVVFWKILQFEESSLKVHLLRKKLASGPWIKILLSSYSLQNQFSFLLHLFLIYFGNGVFYFFGLIPLLFYLFCLYLFCLVCIYTNVLHINCIYSLTCWRFIMFNK